MKAAPAWERADMRVTMASSSHGGETIVLGKTSARRVGTRNKLPGRLRFTVTAGLLVCFGLAGIGAAAPSDPGGLTVRRSARAIPRKFVVQPNEATVAANQTQRFEVTDAQGKSVAVRWNVSGIGCSGLACGTIDDHGVYRSPSSLPQPRFITLEGVLISDPNYSVLTQVRLEEAATAVSSRDSSAEIRQVATPPPAVTRPAVTRPAATQPAAPLVSSAPMIGNLDPARSVKPLPLLAVSAAPVIAPAGERRSAGRSVEAPLPTVIAAAPAIAGMNSARAVEAIAPSPTVIAAAPLIERQNVARSFASPPVPTAIAAAPPIEDLNSARAVEALPAPTVVSAAPTIAAPMIENAKRVGRSLELPSSSTVIAAAPVIERQNVTRSIALPPLPVVIDAAPAVQKRDIAHTAELPPLPKAITAAPAVERREVARKGASSTLPIEIATLSPVVQPIVPKKTQELTPVVAPRSVPAGPALQPMTPMPNASAQATPGTSAQVIPSTVIPGTVIPGTSAQNAPGVTYRDGLLTVAVENSTLAAVLGMIAEKTGAVIDVPAGGGLDRIVAHAGPGRPEDVLAQLLNGSAFDFVIVGYPEHPRDLAQVLLFPHQAETAASLSPSPAPSAPLAEVPKHGLAPDVLDKLFSRKPKPE